MDLLLKRLQGGNVSRYHTIPSVGPQTVAAHTWRAMCVLMTLWPDTRLPLLLTMLWHDVTEAELGDLPAPAKWSNKQLADLFERAEAEQEKELQIPVFDLTSEELVRRRLSDYLELVIHCTERMNQGNKEARIVYERGVRYLRTFESSSSFEQVKPILEKLNEDYPVAS